MVANARQEVPEWMEKTSGLLMGAENHHWLCKVEERVGVGGIISKVKGIELWNYLMAR